MAEVCGIKTVPHALIKGQNGFFYITKRVDRILSESHVGKLAMEDFCQLELRLTRDKYRGSYERCAKVISQYSAHSTLDQTELFMRLVFCFMTGNSDMHLKNFSLMETSEDSHEYILSPAYDLLPVNLLMPEDREQTALTLNGKKAGITKKDFLIYADHAGIGEAVAEKMIQSLLAKEKKLLQLCEESFLPEDMKQNLAALIQQRCSIL